MDFRYFMANYWWVNASIFKIINIIHLIRNATFIPLKINFLYTIKKPIYPQMGFFYVFPCSTLIL